MTEIETQNAEMPRAAVAAEAEPAQPAVTGGASGVTETLDTVDTGNTRFFTPAGSDWGTGDTVAPFVMLGTTPVRERAIEDPRIAFL